MSAVPFPLPFPLPLPNLRAWAALDAPGNERRPRAIFPRFAVRLPRARHLAL